MLSHKLILPVIKIGMFINSHRPIVEKKTMQKEDLYEDLPSETNSVKPQYSPPILKSLVNTKTKGKANFQSNEGDGDSADSFGPS